MLDFLCELWRPRNKTFRYGRCYESLEKRYRSWVRLEDRVRETLIRGSSENSRCDAMTKRLLIFRKGLKRNCSVRTNFFAVLDEIEFSPFGGATWRNSKRRSIFLKLISGNTRVPMETLRLKRALINSRRVYVTILCSFYVVLARIGRELTNRFSGRST